MPDDDPARNTPEPMMKVDREMIRPMSEEALDALMREQTAKAANVALGAIMERNAMKPEPAEQFRRFVSGDEVG